MTDFTVHLYAACTQVWPGLGINRCMGTPSSRSDQTNLIYYGQLDQTSFQARLFHLSLHTFVPLKPSSQKNRIGDAGLLRWTWLDV
jgi:hypothetical protein